MPNPAPYGFRNYSVLNGIGSPSAAQLLSRRVEAASVLDIKPGSPLIVGATGTLKRAAVTGTNEVQILTPVAVTAGTWTISFGGYTTVPALAWNATPAQIQYALEQLPSIGSGNITVTGGVNGIASGVVTLTFGGLLSCRNVAQVTVGTGSLTATSLTPSTTTPGVNGYVTSTVFLGFSESWWTGPWGGTAAPYSSLPRWMAQPPINLEAPPGTSPDDPYGIDIKFQSPVTRIYEGSIEFDQAVTLAMIDQTYSIGWLGDLQQCYVATQIATNAVVKVVGVNADQIGVLGGKVKFQLIPAAIANA